MGSWLHQWTDLEYYWLRSNILIAHAECLGLRGSVLAPPSSIRVPGLTRVGRDWASLLTHKLRRCVHINIIRKMITSSYHEWVWPGRPKYWSDSRRPAAPPATPMRTPPRTASAATRRLLTSRQRQAAVDRRAHAIGHVNVAATAVATGDLLQSAQPHWKVSSLWLLRSTVSSPYSRDIYVMCVLLVWKFVVYSISVVLMLWYTFSAVLLLLHFLV